MQLHILSDVHTEFADFDLPEIDADVIVLAGGIGVGTGGLDWLSRQRRGSPVTYVPGNHEFYRHDLSLIDELRSRAPRDVHVLDNEAVVLGKVRFLGSTLWADFEIFGEMGKWFSIQRARQCMNDFALIRWDGCPAENVYLALRCGAASPFRIIRTSLPAVSTGRTYTSVRPSGWIW